jgi:hypothetical protein
MRTQLDRLLTAIGIPHVELGILPVGVPLDTAPQHAFVLYDDVAVVETFAAETTHGEEDSALYAHVMDRLWAQALTGNDARQLVIQATQYLQPDGARPTE